MRVLLSASTFPLRRDDGTPRFVWDLARALAARMEVSVLAPGALDAPESEVWDGVAVRRFTYFVPRSWQRLAYGDGIDVNLRRSWRARATPPFFLAAQARAIRKLVAEARIDLVNSHWILPQGLTAALGRGRQRRFAHVVTLHGGDAHLLASLPGRAALARFILGRTDALLASSTSVRDVFDAALGEASHAGIQPMGVHTARFRDAQPPESEPFVGGYLLFVGRLQEIKGVGHLLRALPRVRLQHPELGLVVVGYGEQEAKL
ncbi:MAG: glycosyltransferase, partial [Myxococcota bacterium]